MRPLSHALHFLTEAVLGAAALALIAVVLLAWRLSLGPLDVTPLAERVEASLAGGGGHVTIGRAALVWEGFHTGGQPLDFQVTDARLLDRDGTLVAVLPSARVALSVPALLRFRLAPETIAIAGARVDLLRTADGTLHLDLAGALATRHTTDRARPGRGTEILRELSRPARPGDLLPWAGQLREAIVTDATVSVDDRVLGLTWQTPISRITLARAAADGGLDADGALAIVLGGARADLTAHAHLTSSGATVHLAMTPIAPGLLAEAARALHGAPDTIDLLRRTTLPVGFTLDGTIDPRLRPVAGTLRATAGAGTLPVGPRGQMALAGAMLEARYTAATLDATLAATAQPLGGDGAPVPIALRAHATRDTAIHADLDLTLGAVRMAELARYWPEGTGGDARRWVTQNITAGTARDARVTASLVASPDLTDATITRIGGGVRGEGLTAWWLRPIPPITDATAIVRLESPDALTVEVPAGHQAGLVIRGGSVRVTGIMAPHQIGAINARIAGPVADALAILANKRLDLARRAPLPLEGSRGTVDSHLTATIPLEDRVTFDQIAIRDTARLSGLRLANILQGRDLDRGQIDLSIGNDGLDLGGTATIGGLPSRLRLAMDFRAGPPSQRTEHAEVTARASVAQLDGFGLPASRIASGAATLAALYDERRDGTATARLSADLAETALATPLAWNKPAGAPASATATLRLTRGHITSVEAIEAHGPDLDISGRAEWSKAGGRALQLARVRVGRTTAHGTVDFPGPADKRTRLVLTGETLDLGGYFRALDRTDAQRAADAAKPPPPPSKAEPPGPPWTARIRFNQVLLTHNRTLGGASLTATDDGLHITEAALSAGAPALVTARIDRAGGPRRLTVDAADSGLALDALGIADNIRAGRLHIDGTYDDTIPASPLAGTATLSAFRVTDAPAAARLLKAATLYGVVDLLRGPGVGFTRMTAPFRWSDRTLRLHETRAVSASLGLTAEGTIDFPRRQLDLRGTVVPAWFFNQLPGRLPLVGRFFSPETGGGVFAAKYTLRGPMDDPAVSVNPLSALAPGALRNLFR